MKCSKCGAESVPGDKFCVACGMLLVVPQTQKIMPSADSLVHSSVGSVASGRTKLLKLTCPSCGGALELPDNLTIAHCIYCGTKILLDQEGVVQERRDLQRYIELCKVAVEAKNDNEVIEYCNRILEIDPKNVEAWINKAVSTYWLSTVAHNRYDEAMEYLKKASQIAPDDSRIDSIQKGLTRDHVNWMVNLGNRSWELASETNDIRQAENAMSYYFVALNYAPDDYGILELIARLAQAWSWVYWGDTVNMRIRQFNALVAKKKLPWSKEELEVAQSKLAELRRKGSFLSGGKIKDAERRIARIQTEIAKLEKDAL